MLKSGTTLLCSDILKGGRHKSYDENFEVSFDDIFKDLKPINKYGLEEE